MAILITCSCIYVAMAIYFVVYGYIWPWHRALWYKYYSAINKIRKSGLY